MRQRKETLRSVSKVSNEKLERVRTKTLEKGNQRGGGLQRPVKMTKEELEERERAVIGKKLEWKDEKGEVDLIKLENLSIESLLNNLQERYNSDRFYV